MTGERSVHLTTEMVRALAHPLRARLLGQLRIHGPSTATRLAERTSTNSGATSYHLRQLAAVGLVEEEPDRGNRRERWWKAAHTQHSWRESEHDRSPEGRAAADWLIRHAHRQHARHVDDWLDVRAEWPIEWRDAADQSDFFVTVTASQLTDLNDRVRELMNEYRSQSSPEDSDAERVVVLYYSFPLRAIDI